MLGGLGEVSLRGERGREGEGERTCCHGEGFGADFEGEDCSERKCQSLFFSRPKMSENSRMKTYFHP